MFDPVEIRMRSHERLKGVRFPEPPADYPLLDPDLEPRAPGEVVERMGALSAVVSVAFGCQRSDAWQWLGEEGLTEALSPTECHFLETPSYDPGTFEIPESLFTLAWALGLLEGADDFLGFVPDSLIQVVPHPAPHPRSTALVRPDIQPVDPARIVAALDLVYCLHWAIVDSMLRGDDLPAAPHPRVVVERRRALEWLLSDQPWDDVAMDT